MLLVFVLFTCLNYLKLLSQIFDALVCSSPLHTVLLLLYLDQMVLVPDNVFDLSNVDKIDFAESCAAKWTGLLSQLEQPALRSACSHAM